jgi:hypothetical protein
MALADKWKDDDFTIIKTGKGKTFAEEDSEDVNNLAPGVPDVLLQGKDMRPDSAYDPEELAMGIKVEMEHTSDPETAKAICKTQLDENRKYYSEMKFKGML